MKKLLLIAFSVILLTSCSKDDDATIVGKWYFYKISVFESGQETVEMYDNDCATKRDYLKFQSDDVVLSYFYDDMCIEEVVSSIYTLDGTDLTIDGDALEVISLTNKTLKLKSISDTAGDYFIYEFKK
jgi:Lipocalin-like domain